VRAVRDNAPIADQWVITNISSIPPTDILSLSNDSGTEVFRLTNAGNMTVNGAMELNVNNGLGNYNSALLVNNNMISGGDTSGEWGLEVECPYSSQGMLLSTIENEYGNTNSLSLIDRTSGDRWNFGVTSSSFIFNLDCTFISAIFNNDGSMEVGTYKANSMPTSDQYDGKSLYIGVGNAIFMSS
jgi:hypothetical protein